MTAVNLLAPDVGMVRACAALRVHRTGVYREDARRRHLSAASVIRAPRPRPPLALSKAERQLLRDALCCERFADCAPPTMYRLLGVDGQTREWRHQLTHPVYAKPELLATGANQVWSWAITKIKGPAKWTCYHLYVILDLFSRYVVGWMIAPRGI